MTYLAPNTVLPRPPAAQEYTTRFMNELCDGFVLQLSATKPSSTSSSGRGSSEKEEITKVRAWLNARSALMAHRYTPGTLLSARWASSQSASVTLGTPTDPLDGGHVVKPCCGGCLVPSHALQSIRLSPPSSALLSQPAPASCCPNTALVRG